MKIRLYMDEDSMDQAVVRALRARAVDVTTAWDEDMLACDDHEHPDYATVQGRVLFSFNVGDFYDLHTRYLAEGRSHAGIILARQQVYSVGELMHRLLRLISVRSAKEMKNWVEFLGAWGDSVGTSSNSR